MPREIPLKNAEGGQQIEQLDAKKNKSAVKKEKLFLNASIQVRFLYHLLFQQQAFSMKFIIIVMHSFIYTSMHSFTQKTIGEFSTICQALVTQRKMNRLIFIIRWEGDFM